HSFVRSLECPLTQMVRPRQFDVRCAAPLAEGPWSSLREVLLEIDEAASRPIGYFELVGQRKKIRCCDNRISRHAARLTAEALQRNRDAPVGGVVDEVGRLESSSVEDLLEFRSGQPVQIV